MSLQPEDYFTSLEIASEKHPRNDKPYIRSKRRGALRHAIFSRKSLSWHDCIV
jgi:hypothetical protein